MALTATRGPGPLPVKQFSVFADNKVGRLHDMIRVTAEHDITVLGFCTVDTTDSAIIRLVVNYWEQAKDAFRELGVSYTVNDVLAVALPSVDKLAVVTTALQQAEVNIHYAYPLLVRPQNSGVLILRLEDHDLAAEVLRSSGLQLLDQHDLAR